MDAGLPSRCFVASSHADAALTRMSFLSFRMVLPWEQFLDRLWDGKLAGAP